MANFIVRRLLTMLLTMFIVSIFIFALAEIAPGNVARNILGAFATPEQEASFREQLGLNQPLHIRYINWLVGSDWRASRLIGMPLTRIKKPGTDFYQWWAVDEDGTLVRWKLEEEDLIALRRQTDGTVEESLDNDRWQTDEEGVSRAWGVDTHNHAVMWEKGSGETYWMRAKAAGWWVEKSGGPRTYIPLQKGMLRGDPGQSVQTGRPVADTLARRIQNSAILAGIAFAIVMPLALVLGLIAGLNEGKPTDRILSVAGLITTSTPEFATGIFLILILASWLKLVPGATVFGSERAIFENPKMLILPVLTLTLIELGYVLRITRASMVEVMREPYIRTAFIKGLPYSRIVFKHAIRNALMAPITVIMLHVNWLIGGIVVVEAIFGFPGLGKYLYESALYKDIFAIEAGAMVMVFFAVGTQLVADIVYTFLNPRIRYA
ncbi:MAG: peptide ABC transporter permease [Chloroflexi bacterium B3_Chlor]|nr:MAG: peptide ABC transporter permease [Chloroflexi bacterium B3_Chlor]